MAMTFFTIWGMGVIFQKRLSMDPSYIVCLLLGVAVSAIDLFQIIGMWKSFISCINMAG